MHTTTKPAKATRTGSPPVLDCKVTDCEVIAHFGSQSNPNQKQPYEAYCNRYTAKSRCDCRGFRTYGHCVHQEAITALALDQNLIIRVRRGKPAEAKAVIGDYDHFADLNEDTAFEAEIAAYERRQSEMAASDVTGYARMGF